MPKKKGLGVCTDKPRARLRVRVRLGWGRIELREGCAVDGADVGIYTDKHSLHASHGMPGPAGATECEPARTHAHTTHPHNPHFAVGTAKSSCLIL